VLVAAARTIQGVERKGGFSLLRLYGSAIIVPQPYIIAVSTVLT